ncbi:MAG: sulfatase-like hydrolase/transferase [Bacteroidales bacterium]
MNLKPAFVLLLTAFLLWGCAQRESSGPKPPNVILILADDLGYETMPSYGGTSYQTPHIDRLASEGIRFEHCYAQPQCTPSRVKLLTGISNIRNYVRFGLLDTSQVTVAQLFRDAGYATGIGGKWQLGTNPGNVRQLGFDDYLVWQLTEGRADSTGRDTRYSRPVLDHNGQVILYDRTEYGPDAINRFSLDFIEKNSRNDRPFFYLYSMVLVHCPFSPTPDSPEWIDDDTTVMDYKGQAPYFEDMVAYMDRMVGNIYDKLEEEGIAENTLLIFTGDNGTDTPIVSRFRGKDVAGGKLLSTDAGTRVPLIARWPGVIEEGSECNDLTDFSDFMPTVLEAAGISVPDSLDIDGISFLPQLKGLEGTPRKWVYSWYMNPMKREARVFARTHRYKLFDTGEFYESSVDVLEEHPLSSESLDQEAADTKAMLEEVLSGYEKRRFDALPAPPDMPAGPSGPSGPNANPNPPNQP